MRQNAFKPWSIGLVVRLIVIRLFLWLLLPLMGERILKWLPKILLHEHLDCSVRPLTMLELWSEIGFDKATMPFPDSVLHLWHGGHRDEAAVEYQQYLVKFASSSLSNYIYCIVEHILPVMQTEHALYRIARERIEDAVQDGIVLLSLRFAPQLHTAGGLTLDQVVGAVTGALDEAPANIYVDLTVCALRHEDGQFMNDLHRLCVDYADYIGCLDLAGDESLHKGVLQWWATGALKIREARAAIGKPIHLKLHIGETDDVTAQDNQTLDRAAIEIEGHGIRDWLSRRLREMCPTSNVITGQCASLIEHVINKMLLLFLPLCLNTDGLTLTGLRGLSHECHNMHQAFGWRLAQFGVVMYNALRGFASPEAVQRTVWWMLRLSCGSERRCRRRLQRLSST